MTMILINSLSYQAFVDKAEAATYLRFIKSAIMTLHKATTTQTTQKDMSSLQCLMCLSVVGTEEEPDVEQLREAVRKLKGSSGATHRALRLSTVGQTLLANASSVCAAADTAAIEAKQSCRLQEKLAELAEAEAQGASLMLHDQLPMWKGMLELTSSVRQSRTAEAYAAECAKVEEEVAKAVNKSFVHFTSTADSIFESAPQLSS